MMDVNKNMTIYDLPTIGMNYLICDTFFMT